MSLDPSPSPAHRPISENDTESLSRPPDDAALAALTGLTDPESLAPEPGQEPIRTLLWTAATVRPLDEVAALVSLLKRTGEVPNPGDEALRAAAVARPLEEVMRLVALLNEPPHACDEADTTLRAAAVGRPIEDVAQLVAIIGGDAGGENRTHRPATAAGSGRGDPAPAEPVVPTGFAAAFSRPVAAAFRTAGPVTAERPNRPAGTAGTVPLTGPSSAVRSVLRLPAAVLLLLLGSVHLPTEYGRLATGGSTDVMALVLTVAALVCAVWLAVRDTPPVWTASAATALCVVVAHALAGIGGFSLLESSVGDAFTWANVVAVVCSVTVAALAGSALLSDRRAARAGGAGHS